MESLGGFERRGHYKTAHYKRNSVWNTNFLNIQKICLWLQITSMRVKHSAKNMRAWTWDTFHTWSGAALWCLRHTQRTWWREQRGRTPRPPTVHDHGQRTGRSRLSSDPGLLMDVSGNPAGREGARPNLARSERIKILHTVHFSLPLSFLRN